MITFYLQVPDSEGQVSLTSICGKECVLPPLAEWQTVLSFAWLAWLQVFTLRFLRSPSSSPAELFFSSIGAFFCVLSSFQGSP